MRQPPGCPFCFRPGSCVAPEPRQAYTLRPEVRCLPILGRKTKLTAPIGRSRHRGYTEGTDAANDEDAEAGAGRETSELAETRGGEAKGARSPTPVALAMELARLHPACPLRGLADGPPSLGYGVHRGEPWD